MKVDLVYLWVDGSDEQWQEALKCYASKEKNLLNSSIDPCRFKDNDELKYSLRSVEHFATWINTIFIVTNGQVPKWLDTKNSRVKIINHNEIMPEEALPTFNSEAIETCLDRIPGLSEHFILANDDFFFLKKVDQSYFFSEEGIPIFRMVEHQWDSNLINSNTYCYNVLFSQNLVTQKLNISLSNMETTHSFMPITKTLFRECKECFKNEFYNTTIQRFRKPYSVQKTILAFYALGQKKGILNLSKKTSGKVEDLCINLTSIENAKKSLKKYRPKTFCLNDNEKTGRESKKIKSLLQEIYKDSSTFEKELSWRDYLLPAEVNTKAINLVFSIDDAYVKFLSVTIDSILTHSTEDINFFVLDDNISDINKKLLSEQIYGNNTIKFIDVSSIVYEVFGNVELKTRLYWTKSIYYRLLIPVLFKKYDRVLYLDSDIIVCSNINEIYEKDTADKSILAVKDTISPILDFDKQRKKQIKEDLRISSSSEYFNSGVILYDLNNINIDEYIENVKKAFLMPKLLFPDQDILNFVFKGKVKMAELQYNTQIGAYISGENYLSKLSSTEKTKYLSAVREPKIIHFTGNRKPWNEPTLEHAQYFWLHARNTKFYEMIVSNLITETCVTKEEFKQLRKLPLIVLKLAIYKILSKVIKNNYRYLHKFNREKKLYKKAMNLVK